MSIKCIRRVSFRNKTRKGITNARCTYFQSEKNTGFGYLIDFRTVDVESGRYLSCSPSSVQFGDIEVGEEKSVAHDIMFNTGKRGYWQVYFEYKGTSYKINKNNAQVNPWEMDDGKYVEITVRREKKRFRVEFDMESGHAYFYAVATAGQRGNGLLNN